MLQNWVSSINGDQYKVFTLNTNHLGLKTDFFLEKVNPAVPSVAILGTLEEAADLIRHQLYQFQAFDDKIQIIDLGQVRKTNDDFLIPLLVELISNGVVPIIIGQKDLLIKAQSIAAYNCTGQANIGIFSPNIFENDFLVSEKVFPNSLTWIGKQAHMADSGHHDGQTEIVRLGQLRNDIASVETTIRNANVFNFSLSALKFADAPAQSGFSASALSLEEGCQLMRYVGFNERVTSIAFSDYIFQHDLNERTANSIAQLIWYMLEGMTLRTVENVLDDVNKQIYNVNVNESNTPLTFVKSIVSGRWWIKINDQTYKACTYEDYKQASNNGISDRVFNYLQGD